MLFIRVKNYKKISRITGMYIFRIVKSTINKKWDRRLEMALNNKKRVFCASFFVLLAMLFLIGFLIKDVVGKEKIPKIGITDKRL